MTEIQIILKLVHCAHVTYVPSLGWHRLDFPLLSGSEGFATGFNRDNAVTVRVKDQK